MPVQRCPNCQKEQDVSVYVTGQKIPCSCGIHFEVIRSDVSSVKPGVSGNKSKVSEIEPRGAEPTVIAKAVTIPGFEMAELLGRGGMGEVWKARQVSLNRFVAVKILARNLASDPEFVARFDKETTALAALSHPNIVQIIDRGNIDATYYFIMELVEGRSLRDLIAAGRVNPSEALRIVSQICRAMDYAHERGIIHRDLKPENILLDAQNNVKVADFGLAGIALADERLNVTKASTAMGTLHYMAPEQRRDARAVDGRADVYSVGVILYEVLTGEVPLGRFKLPSQRLTGVDPRVDSIVEKALEPEPASRYERASQIWRDIDSLITTQPHVASKNTRVSAIAGVDDPPRVAGRSFRRRRRRIAGLGLVAVLAAGFVLGRVWFARPILSAPGSVEAPQIPVPPDTRRDRSLLATVSKNGSTTRVDVTDFREGGTNQLSMHSGLWDYRDGKLFAEVVVPADASAARFTPRAYLETPRFHSKAFEAEVITEIDPRPPTKALSGQAEAALLFRADGDETVGVHAVFSFDPKVGSYYVATWRYLGTNARRVDESEKDSDVADEDEILPPEPRHPLKLKVKIGPDGTMEGFANEHRFFVQKLATLPALDGRIGFECRNALCRFSGLTVKGVAAETPGKPAESPGKATEAAPDAPKAGDKARVE